MDKPRSPTTRILNKLIPENFRLPTDDTRKTKHLCRQRRTLLLELRGYADSDGSKVEMSVLSVMKGTGWARSTVFARLDDLKKLGLVIDGDRIGFNRPRRRSLNLARAQELLAGAASPEQDHRPANLPTCIPTSLWQQFIAAVQADDGDFEFVLQGVNHYLALGFEEDFVAQCLRHSIAIRFISMDLWFWEQHCNGNCQHPSEASNPPSAQSPDPSEIGTSDVRDSTDSSPVFDIVESDIR